MATIVTAKVPLPEDAIEALHTIAEERHTSMAEVLRHAISLEKLLHEETKHGAKVLLWKPDGKFYELETQF